MCLYPYTDGQQHSNVYFGRYSLDTGSNISLVFIPFQPPVIFTFLHQIERKHDVAHFPLMFYSYVQLKKLSIEYFRWYSLGTEPDRRKSWNLSSRFTEVNNVRYKFVPKFRQGTLNSASQIWFYCPLLTYNIFVNHPVKTLHLKMFSIIEKTFFYTSVKFHANLPLSTSASLAAKPCRSVNIAHKMTSERVWNTPFGRHFTSDIQWSAWVRHYRRWTGKWSIGYE